MENFPFARKELYGSKKPSFPSSPGRIRQIFHALLPVLQERFRGLFHLFRRGSSSAPSWRSLVFRWRWRALGALGGALLLYMLFIVFTLPDVDDIGALFAAESTVVTDRRGIELYRIHGDEDRTFIPLERMAEPVKQATIAIEDQRFYERGCFDPRAFLRAALRNVIGGFGSEEGEVRMQKGKIQDASDLRDDDFWLGIIGAHVGAGSGVYIGGRTDQVLQNMETQGFISEKERLHALQELQTITFQRERENIRAPHFVFAVRDQVAEMFAMQLSQGFLENGGLKIVTTLDWKLQEAAEKIITEVGTMNEDVYGAHNAALLAVDRENGQILTYVGNRDYWDTEADGN